MAFNFTRDGQNYTLDTFDSLNNLDSEINGRIAVNVGGQIKFLALSTKIEKDEASDLYVFVAGKRFALLQDVYFEYFINANTTNLNLQTFLSNQSAPTNARARIIINSCIYVYSTDTANAAIISGDLSAYSGVKLVNNGYIYGKGGVGGNGGYSNNGHGTNGGNGSAGGDALTVESTINILNNGTIGSGGGGAGGATVGGDGGVEQNCVGCNYSTNSSTNGSAGTPTAGGSRGTGASGHWQDSGEDPYDVYCTGGHGGNGGNLGTVGVMEMLELVQEMELPITVVVAPVALRATQLWEILTSLGKQQAQD